MVVWDDVTREFFGLYGEWCKVLSSGGTYGIRISLGVCDRVGNRGG